MAVLDGIDAGFRGPANALRAVSVCGDFAPETVSVGDKGLHFLERVLRSVGIVALGHDSAGGADLDDVGAILDDLADFMLDGWNAVGDTIRGLMEIKGKQIFVAVSAGDSKGGAADEHVRSGYVAIVDGIAQSNITVPAGADVAHGGEACEQSEARVPGSH